MSFSKRTLALALAAAAVACGGHKPKRTQVATAAAPITSTAPVTSDDHGDDAASATALGAPRMLPGVAADGKIDPAGDVDWFQVDLTAGSDYQFRTVALTGMDSVLRLIDSDGVTQLAENDDVSAQDVSSRLAFRAPRDGSFYLEVRDKTGLAGGSYRLVATTQGLVPSPNPNPSPNPSPSPSPNPSPNPSPSPNPNDDHGNDAAHATTTQTSAPRGGVINYAGDEDWFAVDLSAGVDYSFLTLNLAGGMDTVLKVYDTNGTSLLGENDDVTVGDPSSRVDITTTTAGTHYFAVRHKDAAATSGSYDVNVVLTAILPPPPRPDDHGNDAQHATAVAVGSTTAGEIENSGDVDWFKVDLVGGTAYEFRTENLQNGMDTILTLIDTDGLTLLDQNDDSRVTNPRPSSFLASRVPNDPTLSFTPPADGTYYLYVEHYSGSASSGNYDVIVASWQAPVPNADDHGNDAQHATAMAVGGTVAGRIENAGDRDWFKVDLQAGFGYEFRTGNLQSMDTILTLVDTDGLTQLDENDDDRTATSFTLASRVPNDPALSGFVAPATGTYYLFVRHYSGNSVGGSYDVTVTTTSLPPGPALTRAELQDVDGSFDASAGDTLTLTFDQPLVLTGSDPAAELALPVAGDAFGSGATIAAAGSSTLVVTLGQAPHLLLSGSFDPARTVAGSPSGVDVGPASTIAAPNGATAQAGAVDLTSTLAAGFHPVASLVTARGYHSATLLDDGRVLVVGGLADASTPAVTNEIHDAGVWTETHDPSLGGNPDGLMVALSQGQAFAVARFDHTATKLANGHVLIAGGFGYERLDANGAAVIEELHSAFLFDPQSNRFTPTALPLTDARRAHHATLLPNGQVLISGGYSSLLHGGQGGTLRTAELYDPFQRAFVALSPTGMDLVLPRQAGTADLVGSDVVLAGGHRWDVGQVGSAVALYMAQGSERFDLTRGFTTGSPLLQDRRWHASAKVGQDLLVLAGDDGQGAIATLERYDAAQGTFAAAGQLLDPRARLQVAPLGADELLVVGGVTLDYAQGVVRGVASGERFKVGPNVSERYALSHERNSHAVVPLGPGRVLVVGGFEGGATTVSGMDGQAVGECEAFVIP